MQYFVKKIFIVLFVTCTSALFAQFSSIDSLKSLGDNAFVNKEYFLAKKHYENLVKNERFVSELILYRLSKSSEILEDKKDELLYATMLFKYYPRKRNRAFLNTKTSNLGIDSFFSNAFEWLSVKIEWWSTYINIIFLLFAFVFSCLAFFFWFMGNLNHKTFSVLGLVTTSLFLLFQLWYGQHDRLVSYLTNGEEFFYSEPSYASDVVDGKKFEYQLFRLEDVEGPWIKMVNERDTMFLPKKEEPFRF